MKTHTCRKCGETKALMAFYMIRGHHTSPCKACVRAAVAAYREEHKAEIRERARQAYAADKYGAKLRRCGVTA